MDASIQPSDKQARNAFVKARDNKQAAKNRRAKKRKDRQDSRRHVVARRRLRRHIEKAVSAHLLEEKQNYLRGEPTGDNHTINTSVRYRQNNWYFRQSFIEGILNNALAKHTGFEHKAEFLTESDHTHDDWCNRIYISYTLLGQ